ncbi:MAG: proton extrusion protein PcxA [Pleurocapsa minor HA4230-MV1]|nr:proton extrusion protein PcxA [Pleurocapsa minor HA4230-MV1]
MKNSLDNHQTEVILHNLLTYSQNSYQWFTNTPARALERAYLAALSIKSLKADYATSQNQTKMENNQDIILNYLQSDIDRYLTSIKVNLAEFKVSRFFLNNHDQGYWSKIILIEEVLNEHRENNIELPIVSEVNTIEKLEIKIDSQTQGKDNLTKVPAITQKTGALPRSLGRTFQKIKTDLKSDSEVEVIQNFRRQRRVTQAAIRCLLLLIIIPLITQKISKQFFLLPLVENYRKEHHSEIFINLEMKEEAFKELQNFEEELKFNNLLSIVPAIAPEIIEEKLKEKVNELAVEFRHKSNSSISNVFADLLGLFTFVIVALTNSRGITAIKSFLDDIMYGLSDSAKAFLIILFTDVFVGFHSPHGWEVILEGLASHLGVQPNHSAIFLFIATFPVILDTILKYWIFRYLNRISPSAVATLKNMNE